MPGNHVNITLKSEVPKSSRVLQVSGMFDLPVEQRQERSWNHTLPLEEKDWQVGLIVGPSGAGKSVLANKLWPDKVKESYEWDNNLALVDNFDKELNTKEISAALTAVGLSAIPTWVRAYSTLSNGERFRADMARALTEQEELVVIDEFTSVVDRQVAQVASHCVQKSVRRSNKQFVAVTCHYDVEEWLQPDWIYDVSTQDFRWRSVQPHPPIELNIREAHRSEWHLFAHHHYMSADLLSSAKCYVAEINHQPVAFTSYIHFMHWKTRNIKMAHRVVVLPDYQGLGIAGRLADWMGQHLWEQGYRYRYVVAHPGLVKMFTRSPRWARTNGRIKKVAATKKSQNKKANLSSRRLAMASFEYRAPKKQD